MSPKILVVDDNLEATELAQMALLKIDPNISTEKVFGGQQALEFLKTASELPTLILLDLNMPGMNGIETLRSIRADKRLKHIPVLIVTISNLQSDMKAAAEAGADGYVNKEFSLREFSKNLEPHVKKWLLNARSRNSASSSDR